MGFGHVETFSRSFWTISIDMKKPYEFEVWIQKCVLLTKIGKYLICGLNQEISIWKLFFWKVQVIGYIFHIYHMCSKWILIELRSVEVTSKIIVFCEFYFKKCYLRVHGKDSKWIPWIFCNLYIVNNYLKFRKSLKPLIFRIFFIKIT